MMRVQNNSILLACLLLVGCASTNDYQTYVDTQKTLNKDYTMAELARISALTELVKDSQDVSVRIQAIKALQEIQRSKRPLVIDRPKSWLER
jgi:PBP1b-binding outer membrane lipoprotein LpoB